MLVKEIGKAYSLDCGLFVYKFRKKTIKHLVLWILSSHQFLIIKQFLNLQVLVFVREFQVDRCGIDFFFFLKTSYKTTLQIS